jgi:chorismate synthase
VGVVIDGIPAGFKIDEAELKRQMKRRAPGGVLDTQRQEADEVRFLSGFFNGRTTGTPLCAVVENQNQHSVDYTGTSGPRMARPGHADYTAHVKYGGFEDFRGGGHFSGRITLAVVIAGAIARQFLREQGIVIGAHIQKIGYVSDSHFNPVTENAEELDSLSSMEFPVLNEVKGELMQEFILNCKKAGNSAGGIIECKVVGLKAGLGEPFFDSIESSVSHLAFSVPAVKGIEFGLGFDITDMKGSEANDDFYVQAGRVRTVTNNNGGINGGITNGMPLIFRVAVKPTPSIYTSQKTVTLDDYTEDVLHIKGRHDPCIVRRAVPVIESIAAIALMEHLCGGHI